MCTQPGTRKLLRASIDRPVRDHVGSGMEAKLLEGERGTEDINQSHTITSGPDHTNCLISTLNNGPARRTDTSDIFMVQRCAR